VKKIVVYEIKFCNSACPHFYHNYEDFENIWCARINKKICDADLFILDDYEKHPIPEECPLEMAI